MKDLILVIISSIFTLPFFGQGVWEHYNTNSGLTQNQLTGAVIENEENIWLLSEFDLIKFNYKTKQFSQSYNAAQSLLISQNYTNLIEANGRIWFSHDDGLTSIDSNVIIHYDTSNGLLSNTINKLAIDTSGQLYIASTAGVSYFDGTNFNHDTSVAAYHIAIDDSNRIFIISRRFNLIFNNNGPFLTHQVYDGVSWSTPAVTGIGNFPVGILNIKFIKSKEGIFITSKDYDGGAYRLSYPFHLDSVPLVWPLQSGNRSFRINQIAIADNGRKWITSDNNLVLFSTTDSILTPYNLNPEVSRNLGKFENNEVLITKGDLTIFSHNNGVFLGSKIQKATTATEFIGSNQIEASVSSLGTIFHDLDQAGSSFEFPKGSSKHAIYQAQFVHVHKRASENFFQSNLIRLNGRTHNIGPVIDNGFADREWTIKMTKAEIDLHLLSINNRGYTSPENIANWPAVGNENLGINIDLAPFVDVNNNGCYEPDIGDYPFIKGDEAIYWINHIEMFEYHGMLYAYYDTVQAIQQSLYLDYTIVNRDTAKYDSIKLGMYTDFDLGNPQDDYVGCDSTTNSFYVYNADSVDESRAGLTNYGANAPALGIRFLNEDLHSFVSYANGTSFNGTPTTIQHWQNYLNGKWRNGNPIRVGGNGNNLTGAITKRMFTGNAFTANGWNELTPQSQPLNDRRVIASFPFFGLNIGERKTFSIALSFGIDSTNTSVAGNLPALFNSLQIAEQKWSTTQNGLSSYADTNCTLIATGLSITNIEQRKSFTFYPNPTNSILNIKFNEFNIDVIRVFNSNGRLVISSLVSQNKMKLDFSGLTQGLYFVQYGSQTEKVLLIKN